MTIYQLQQQLQQQERQLRETGKLIDELAQLLAEERLHTQKLIEQSQQKPPQPQPEAIAPPKPTKAEQVAQMTDDQLLIAMQTPQKMAELFKGL